MITNLDRAGIYLKIMFDGYDFVHTEVGQMLVSPNKYPLIKRTTYLPILYDEQVWRISFIRVAAFSNGFV